MVFEKIQDLPQELKTIIFSFLHVNIRLELLLDSFYPSFKIDVLNEEVKATKRDFGEILDIYDHLVLSKEICKKFEYLKYHPDLKPTYYKDGTNSVYYSSIKTKRHPLILEFESFVTFHEKKITNFQNIPHYMAIVPSITIYNIHEDTIFIIKNKEDWDNLPDNHPKKRSFGKYYNKIVERMKDHLYSFGEDPISIILKLSRLRCMEQNEKGVIVESQNKFNYDIKKSVIEFIIAWKISNLYKKNLALLKKEITRYTTLYLRTEEMIKQSKEIKMMKNEEKNSKKLNVCIKKEIRNKKKLEKKKESEELKLMKKEESIMKKIVKMEKKQKRNKIFKQDYLF
jgi:hypothetical protein